MQAIQQVGRAPLAVIWPLFLLLIGVVAGLLAVSPQNAIVLIVGLAGALGLAVSLVRPEWGFLFLVFATYLNMSEILVKNHGLVPVEKILTILVFVGLVVRSALHHDSPFRHWSKENRTTFLILLAYVSLTGLSLLYAEDYPAALEATVRTGKDALFAVLVMLFVRHARDLRAAIWAILCAGLVLGAITSYQHFTASYDNTFGGFGEALKSIDIDNPDGDQRLSGPLGDPNFFGQILVVVVILAWDRTLGEKGWIPRLLAACCLVLVLVSIVATFSRGAFLALSLVTIAMIIRYHFRPSTLALCVLACLVLFATLPASYTERLEAAVSFLPGFEDTTSKSDQAVVGRLDEMAAGIYMFLDRPVLGVGAGNYENHFREYTLRRNLMPRYEERKSHSYYIELAAERGGLGLLAFGFLACFLARGIVRARRNLRDAGLQDHSRLAMAIGMGLLGYAIAALTLHDDFSRYMWLLIGLALSLPQVADNEIGRLEQVPGRRGNDEARG